MFILFLETASHPNYSPIGVIKKLLSKFPEYIQLIINPIGDDHSTDGLKIITASVVFENYRSFVGSDQSPETALRKAANLATQFLQQSLTSNDVDRKGFLGGIKDVLEEQSDKKFLEILTNLKSYGYKVHPEDNTIVHPENFDLVYRYTFQIPGLGIFSGQTSPSRTAAFNDAAQGLISFVTGNYNLFSKRNLPIESPKQQKQQQKTFIAEEMENGAKFSQNGIQLLTMLDSFSHQQIKLFDSESQFSPVVKNGHLENLDLANPQQHAYSPVLLLCDYKWIKLINHFNDG